MRDTREKLTKTTIILHWVVTLLIFVLLAGGIYMEETESYSFYPLHKSFGVIALILAVIRVIWLMMNGWTKPITKVKKIDSYIAKVVHWGLIIGTIIMPISGLMLSGVGGHGVRFFGFELIARNPDLSNPEQVIPFSKTIAEFSGELHEIGGSLLIAAIALHILGLVKHRLKYRDGTTVRMFGREIDKK